MSKHKSEDNKIMKLFYQYYIIKLVVLVLFLIIIIFRFDYFTTIIIKTPIIN